MVTSLHNNYSSCAPGIIIMITLITAIPGVILTSSPPPPSNGYFCPGPVQFTCVGTEISSLTWRINNTYRGTYRYLDEMSIFPQTPSLSPLLPDVNIMITSGSNSRIESTLNAASVSNLRGTLIECSSLIVLSMSLILLFTSAKVLNL